MSPNSRVQPHSPQLLSACGVPRYWCRSILSARRPTKRVWKRKRSRESLRRYHLMRRSPCSGTKRGSRFCEHSGLPMSHWRFRSCSIESITTTRRTLGIISNNSSATSSARPMRDTTSGRRVSVSLNPSSRGRSLTILWWTRPQSMIHVPSAPPICRSLTSKSVLSSTATSVPESVRVGTKSREKIDLRAWNARLPVAPASRYPGANRLRSRRSGRTLDCHPSVCPGQGRLSTMFGPDCVLATGL